MAGRFDIDRLLSKLDKWCAAQTAAKVRLVKSRAMTDAQIDRIPRLLEAFPMDLPTPYDRGRFVIPRGYRSRLRRCGGVHIHIAGHGVWETFNVFRPGTCAKAHLGAKQTLCDSWVPSGTTVDDREFSTTALISFATAGYNVEASRWCFYIGGKGAPAIYQESNDYEANTGWYVDTGEPLSQWCGPLFSSFERWFVAVVETITSAPLDLEQRDVLVGAIEKRSDTKRPHT
jgi:hypothetical protein